MPHILTTSARLQNNFATDLRRFKIYDPPYQYFYFYNHKTSAVFLESKIFSKLQVILVCIKVKFNLCLNILFINDGKSYTIIT